MALAIEHDAENRDWDADSFGGGMATAVVLHVVLLAAIVALAWWGKSQSIKWGGEHATEGAIQASMVSAIPLPHETPPVPKQVLAPEVTSPAPAPPKEAAAPPPKPTDLLIKAKPEKAVKPAPVEAPPPPKHAQPAPETPKAQTGQVAAQLPSSTVQVGTGSSTVTVMDQSFGARYAYYLGIVARRIGQNWYKTEADPQSSAGRKVTLLFDITRDGTPTNIRVETRSGSPSLDQSAVHALQRIDTFGPSPAMGTVTVEDTFVYGNP